MGAVVSRKPDFVHAVVETDDPVFRHDLSYVAHDALWRWREPDFVCAVSDTAEDFAAQPGKDRINPQLAFDPVSQQREAGTDIADDLGVRKIHLLDAGGGKADMDHFRTVRAHDEGRFLHGVVPDRNDEIGMVHAAGPEIAW